MLWWVLGVVTTIAVLGYIAHKYPTWFGKAVDSGAVVVNSVDDAVKSKINQK